MRKVSPYLIVPVVAGVVAVVVIASLPCLRRRLDAAGLLTAYRSSPDCNELVIEYPLDETLFPPELAAPTFRWIDRTARSDTYVVAFESADGHGLMEFIVREPRWTPDAASWEIMKTRSTERDATVTIVGVDRRSPRRVIAGSRICVRTSVDEVGAPIFYREVNLPFIDAVKDPTRIRWRLGAVSSQEQPPIVLEKLPVCGNCHSFSADGAVLGMDVDYANDKGSYAVVPVREEMTLAPSDIITWGDYQREDGEPTFGLLSQVSPDGRYVVSTVKDQSVFVPRPDLAFSQLFFPIKGILCIYDRQNRTFQALPGADDPNLVQSNPSWSPDGKHIVFARSTAYRLQIAGGEKKVLLSPEDCSEFLVDGKPFLYDLYRIPFNEGRGGVPEPIPGASHNGLSNYFARYSPDGRWIVFCKAKSYMLLRPDSELHIIPAEGGEPRKLRANTDRMNSWHSWAPNGRWLVFSSKANSAYTQLFLTHIDEQGNSSPAVVLDRFTASDRAANIPEFVNARPAAIARIREQFLDDYSYLRAGIVSLKADDPKLAEQGYRKALELNPQNVTAHADLAFILLNRGQIADGLAHVREALRLDPNHVEARFNLGLAMLLEEKPEEAAACFERVLQLKPDYTDAHVRLGLLLAKRNRPQKAIDHLSRAAELKPQDGQIHFDLGVLLEGQGRLDDAAEHYTKAARLKPDDAAIPYNLAAVVARQGRLEEAVRHLSRAIQIKPDYTDAYVNLGVMQARQNKHAEAIGSLTKAVQLQPNHVAAHYNLAMALSRTERRREAIEHWTQVVRLQPGNISAWLNLAGCYETTGQRENAVGSLRKALDLARAGGNTSLAQQIEMQLKRFE